MRTEKWILDAHWVIRTEVYPQIAKQNGCQFPVQRTVGGNLRMAVVQKPGRVSTTILQTKRG